MIGDHLVQRGQLIRPAGEVGRNRKKLARHRELGGGRGAEIYVPVDRPRLDRWPVDRAAQQIAALRRSSP
jgi:hypothetical protein